MVACTTCQSSLTEFSANPKVAQFMDEAREVHSKILKANYEKYGDEGAKD